MPTFKIYGASAETGEDTTFTVQANDPVEAEAIASHRRIMVSRVVEIEVSEPQISNLPAVVPQRVTEVQARVMPVVEAPYRYGPVCQACGGDMKKTVHTSGNCLGLMVALLIVGAGLVILILTFWTGIGAVIGAVLMIGGLFVGGKRQKVWRCKSCRAIIARG